MLPIDTGTGQNEHIVVFMMQSLSKRISPLKDWSESVVTAALKVRLSLV